MSTNEFAAFAALDLAPIKMKLMHVESGEGWSALRADAVEAEYRRFLFLMKKYPDAETSPTVDVDTFWHYHILDTMKYASDCAAAFGYFLHHYPYVGLGDGSDASERDRAGERMRAIYEAEFGVAAHAQSAWCGAPNKQVDASAWCGAPNKQVDASAWCGAPNKKVEASAWCGAPNRKVEASAWCGAPNRKVEAIAWCGAPNRKIEASAWCGAPNRKIDASAWLGAPGRKLGVSAAVATAWCGAPNKELVQAA